MSNEDELFLLIKSMNRNEKGYFRKFSKLHGNKEGNYQKLFDYIAVLEDYSDAKVRQQFRSEKFTTDLRITKFYLRKMIIRALRNYYEDQLPQLQRLLGVADVRVMMHKNMNKNLPAKFEKEKNSALANERFVDYMQWSALYYNWLGVYGHSARFIELQEKLSAEMVQVSGQLLNLSQYFDLGAKLSKLYSADGADPSPKVLKKMHELLQHPLFVNQDSALSNMARNIRIDCLALLYQRTGQSEMAILFLTEQIEKTGRSYKGANPSPDNYLVLIHRLLNLYRENNLDEMQVMLNKFGEILFTYKNSIPATAWGNLESTLLVHRARYYLYKRQPANVLPLMAEVRQLLTSSPHPLHHRQLIAMNLEASALFELKQFDKALEIVNTIHNTKYLERSDLMMSAHWLRIMIHMEFRNFEMAKTLISHATRYSKKLKVKLAYENDLYRHFKSMAQKLEGKKRTAIVAEAKEFLQFLEPLPYELYFIQNWLRGIVGN